MNIKNKIGNLILIAVLTVLIGILFAGCKLPVTDNGNGISNGNIAPVGTLAGTQELKKFNSASEIAQFIEQNSAQSNYYGGIRSQSFGRGVMMEAAMDSASPMVKAASVSTGASSGGSNGDGASASDYSTTNIQVEGVDEADFIKNDGKYIYMISQQKFVIVNAFPAKDAEIVSKIDIEGTPVNLFLNGDRVVIFSNQYEDKYMIPEYDYAPRQRSVEKTHAYVYDVSDKSEPKLVNDFDIEGQYSDARMIGDYIYFIAKEYVYYYNHYVDMPMLRMGGKVVASPDIFYFDNPDNNYVFHTIASFNVKDSSKVNAKSYLMGYSNTIYVSEKNIYISYQRNMPYRYYEDNTKERFFSVVVPLFSSDVKSQIDSIKSSDISDSEKWAKISSVLEDMYNNMDENDKNDLLDEIQKAIEEYDVKQELEQRKTIVHKIAISDGDIDYVAKGEVEGNLLNQFSLDEKDGKLRLATTTNIWTSKGSTVYNNVFVLDSDMKQIGELKEIAPEERIYSTRFIGNRLYMVTFKQMDPLFVIDMSSDTPKILGELKIPGFSNYLHPYDENHIIGIGKETGENEWGGVSTKGVKVALFDVSDVENPEEIDHYEIGTSGSDSEALNDHKAFLFDKEKNLLVIPVREIKEGSKYNSRYGYYMQRVWQGAYVFDIGVSTGFKLKGKISHFEGEEESSYYWGSPWAIKRSLFMDDVLYTVSSKIISMNDLNDVSSQVNEVKIPYTEDRYYPPIMY